MRKTLRKFFAPVLAALAALCLSGCGEYVMTEEDLAVQKSIEGYWAADDSTGYNTYDEDGYLTDMVVIEFTDDFHYLMHECFVEQNYVMSYEPIKYSFEDKMFKVVKDGVPSYAEVRVSVDGNTMYWVTDEKTDTYLRVTDEKARELGIPEYSPADWTETESGDDTDGSGGSESTENTETTENTGENGESEE